MVIIIAACHMCVQTASDKACAPLCNDLAGHNVCPATFVIYMNHQNTSTDISEPDKT